MANTKRNTGRRSSKYETPKPRRITKKQIENATYKDVKLLRRFVNDQGKIMPRRVTGTSAKMHRKLVRAIKRSRSIALMPYVEKGTE